MLKNTLLYLKIHNLMVNMKIMLRAISFDSFYFTAFEDCNKKNHQHYAKIEHSVDDLDIINRKLLIIT
ncbi:MAG TPA: hypothetical protein PLJ00_10005 [Chitinophagales bacterium]|nr:hypothetical protein [Chitinophagales bacterium]HRG86313.1 hypothetical protein [Chitinophagales bacterium]HRH52361.1 hypothetical protein [Chitinophagales bacterium]